MTVITASRSSRAWSISSPTAGRRAPYRDADRIVHLQDLVRARDFAEFQKLDVFEDVVATDAYHMTLSEGDLPEAVNSARLSPNAFEFFGVPPLLGRVFTAVGSPDGREPEHAVVISEAFWRRHYGRDPNVIGRTIDLDRDRYTIVGVAPGVCSGGPPTSFCRRVCRSFRSPRSRSTHD